MAADLGLVVHAAEADPHELAAHGARDRLAERGLADAGRADEAQDRALAFGVELAHGEVLEDAPLDLVQAVMVLVEDAARLGDVDALLGQLRPGQLDQPVEVGADHAVLGARLRHALEPRSSFRACFSTSSGMSAFVDRLAQLGDLGAWRLRPRQAPSGSGASARAGCARAGGLAAIPASARRSAWTGAAPRSAARGCATACPGARWTSKVSSSSCFSAGVRSEALATKSASADGD